MAKIHSTAIVDKNAILGENVEIGAYSIIGADVKLGDGCIVYPHVTISGPSTFGENCQFHSGCVAGAPPQDLKYNDEKTELIVGKNNVFRECVTLNRGTTATNKTVIGDNNLLMAYVHIAHDCILGSNIVMANSANIAGHVEIHSNAIIGGITAIHQFTKIGSFAMVGAESKVVKDVLPYSLTDGNPLRCVGLNLIGLKRNGFDKELIKTLKECFKILYYRGLSKKDALKGIEILEAENKDLSYFLDFIKTSDRGLTPRK